MQDWKKEVSAHQPSPLEIVAPDTYIQRKDIMAVEHEATDERDAYTDYECMSREISFSEYNMLKSIEQINTDKAIEEYNRRMEEQLLV